MSMPPKSFVPDEPPNPPDATDLLQTEIDRLRREVRTLRAALKTASRVIQPYLYDQPQNGRV